MQHIMVRLVILEKLNEKELEPREMFKHHDLHTVKESTKNDINRKIFDSECNGGGRGKNGQKGGKLLKIHHNEASIIFIQQ